MKSRQTKDTRTPPSDSQLALEAAEWLVRLHDTNDTNPDPEEPYPDPLERQTAFIHWLNHSPAQLRAFLEIMEVERRVRHPDPQRLNKIQELLDTNPANVIQLYDALHLSPFPRQRLVPLAPPSHRTRRVVLGVAAAVAVMAFAALLSFGFLDRHAYVTGVGEQRTCKLEDGSVVVLNTDTQIDVDFSQHVRNVRLIQCEALFIVEHNTHRPFIVTAGSDSVRAVGTAFNVRRRAHSTEVAVVEGVVQVSTVAVDDVTPAPLRLAAGEKAEVARGVMIKSASRDVEAVLSWRQRRLVFRDAPFAEVVAESNRYNHFQIRVDGSAARDMQLTGIFDTDRPQAIILFAQKNETLSVEAVADNWVVRSREYDREKARHTGN